MHALALRCRAPMRLSLAALVAANLVPLAGVLWLGWSTFEVFALFWSESVVVGGYTVLQLLLQRPANGRWRPRDAVSGLFLAAMFCLHYGMFLFVHAMMLCHLFGERNLLANDRAAPLLLLATAAASSGGLGLWALIASHGVSFVTNFLHRERGSMTTGQLMVRPYLRIVAMHLTLLAGGMLLFVAGPSAVLLGLLVLAKVAVDAAAHRHEHRRAAAPAPATATGA